MKFAWASSFQARTILTTLCASMLVWSSWAAWSILEAGAEKSKRYDESLREGGLVVLTALPRFAIEQGSTSTFVLPPGIGFKDFKGTLSQEFNFQAWSADRRLLSRTSTTPFEPFNPSFADGFSTTTIAGKRWRSFSVTDATGEIQIQVAERQEQRTAAARGEAIEGLQGLAQLLVVLTVTHILAIYWSARPLRRLQQQVAQRASDDITPLPINELPAEVMPLVASFNDLLRRADQARQAQQQFVADAAHELRTPLSVLRLQAEAVIRSSDPEELALAGRRLQTGIDRATRVVEQLLALARLESSAQTARTQRIRLDILVDEVLELAAPLAARKQQTLKVNVQPVEVATLGEMLHIALRNLVDNAIRYSPTSSDIHVSTRREDKDLCIVVTDHGPGLTPEQIELALQPFTRLHEGPETGSGLGLTIVARIARMLGGRLVLQSPAAHRGLQATIFIPGVDQAPKTPDTAVSDGDGASQADSEPGGASDYGTPARTFVLSNVEK